MILARWCKSEHLEYERMQSVTEEETRKAQVVFVMVGRKSFQSTGNYCSKELSLQRESDNF